MGATEKRRESDWGAAVVKDIEESEWVGQRLGVYQEWDRVRLTGLIGERFESPGSVRDSPVLVENLRALIAMLGLRAVAGPLT